MKSETKEVNQFGTEIYKVPDYIGKGEAVVFGDQTIDVPITYTYTNNHQQEADKNSKLYDEIRAIKYAYSAHYLGQTKDYIISQNTKCYIQQNDTEFLHLKCNSSTDLYSFDKETSLCYVFSFDIATRFKNRFIYHIKGDGYKFYGNSYPPVVIPKKHKTTRLRYSKAKVYTNQKYVYTIYETDIQGNANSGYFAVAVHYYKK